MTKQYESNGIFVSSEEDIYAEGCNPDTTQCYDIKERFNAGTKRGIIEAIKNFHCVDDDALSIDSCEEMGRIDVQRLETVDGIQAFSREIEAWKQGNLKLYLVTYSHRVELVERHAVSLI